MNYSWLFLCKCCDVWWRGTDLLVEVPRKSEKQSQLTVKAKLFRLEGCGDLIIIAIILLLIY